MVRGWHWGCGGPPLCGSSQLQLLVMVHRLRGQGPDQKTQYNHYRLCPVVNKLIYIYIYKGTGVCVLRPQTDSFACVRGAAIHG